WSGWQLTDILLRNKCPLVSRVLCCCCCLHIVCDCWMFPRSLSKSVKSRSVGKSHESLAHETIRFLARNTSGFGGGSTCIALSIFTHTLSNHGQNPTIKFQKPSLAGAEAR
ncbi:unnamed protein product, partial [Ectocarpus sp. 12 AP-2014]